MVRMTAKEFSRLKALGASPKPTAKLRLIPTEHEEQVRVIDWASVKASKWPELRLLHAIPNGGSRASAENRRGSRYSPEAQRLRSEGVRSGVPDLDLPVARRGYHGLRIEMKTIDGKVSSQQKWWLDELTAQGYLAVVRHGADEAITTIKWYLEGQRDSLPVRTAPRSAQRERIDDDEERNQCRLD